MSPFSSAHAANHPGDLPSPSLLFERPKRFGEQASSSTDSLKPQINVHVYTGLVCMAHIHSNMPNSLRLTSSHVKAWCHYSIFCAELPGVLVLFVTLFFLPPLIPAQDNYHSMPCSPLNLGLQASPTPQLLLCACAHLLWAWSSAHLLIRQPWLWLPDWGRTSLCKVR